MTSPGQSAPALDDDKNKRKTLAKAQAFLGQELFNLARVEQYDWYMGLVSRPEIEKHMKDQGDFAVRAIDRRAYTELVLSLMGHKCVIHITIICDRKTLKWSLTTIRQTSHKVFDTVPELIDHYKKNLLPIEPPNDDLVLVNPCKRPRWILKRGNIRVVLDKSNMLGSGNFCNVYLGKLNNRRNVAVKVCHTTSTDNKTTEEQIDREILARDQLINEVKLMHNSRHPNILTFYGVCFDKPPVMIVMELCPGDSLFKHLRNTNRGAISTGERFKYSIEAAEGMEFLHRTGLVHRDLAARNCLISKYGIIKIADFGLSQLISELSTMTRDPGKQHIPLQWMAPESLTRTPIFSVKSDVWSYGVLLFEIFSDGQEPWGEKWENKQIATHIRRGQMPDFPEQAPQQIRDLVKNNIWVVDPSKRPEMTGILLRLKDVHVFYPCPPVEQLTLNAIPRVQALTPEEIKGIEQNEEDEDMAKEVIQSVMDAPLPRTDDMGHARERDVTVDETTDGVSPRIPKHPPSTPKPRKTKRTGQQKSIGADTKSRDTLQEHSVEIPTADEKKQKKMTVKKFAIEAPIRPSQNTSNVKRKPPSSK